MLVYTPSTTALNMQLCADTRGSCGQRLSSQHGKKRDSSHFLAHVRYRGHACWRVRAEALVDRAPADAVPPPPPSEQLQLTARAPPLSWQLYEHAKRDQNKARVRKATCCWCGMSAALFHGPHFGL